MHYIKTGLLPAVFLGLLFIVIGIFFAAADSTQTSPSSADTGTTANSDTASSPGVKTGREPVSLVQGGDPNVLASLRPDAKNAHDIASVGSEADALIQDNDKEPEAEKDVEQLLDQESFWNNRLTYPTGRFNPAWLRQAAEEDSRLERAIPAGQPAAADRMQDSPMALDPNSFTALGPKPERMTGCSGCFDYGVTQGRVNAIVVDPTTTSNGSIVAYIATVGGGVAKTTTCCTVATSWTLVTDDPLITTTGVDTLALDPNNHNVIYAGTGDLNFGSFSMGSQGILKSTDAGATWTVLGADVFGSSYVEPSGQYPQYDAVGKVRVDPNNSNRVVAGTKKGLFLSYNGGLNWTGPCTTNGFTTQRQDTTGLELSDMGGGVTRILAAIGTRGFASTVQYDLGNQGANGLYRGTMPSSGCPTDFSLITRNDNGFVYGTAVSGSAYTTGALMNAGSGSPYVSATSGNQLSRMDIAVAPSNPNTIYAQAASINPNSSSGCGSANGCQLGVWSSIDGGNTWSYMTGSSGASLRSCSTGGTAVGGSGTAGGGDYPQNWYDQGMAVDPNNPDRVFIDTFDTWLATRTGTNLYNVTCGYSGSNVSSHIVHVDHHALAFVHGSSDVLLEGSDGGIFSTSNAGSAAEATLRPTWVNMDTGLNTIEFYSGDISGNFATSTTPYAVGGAQDNGPSSVMFAGTPTSGVQWQMGLGGDGFSGAIDPMGTGTGPRIWEGNNSGGFSRCTSNCTASGASWVSSRGAWTGDQQSFVLPINLFRGGIPGGDDCAPAGATTGCGHLIAGTTRVWETISGAASSVPTSAWYNTNAASCSGGTTACLTKGTLGNRSFITQVKYSPKFQSVAIVGTNDGNVQIGFNLGTGVANQGNWVNVTGGNALLPNRPVLGIALDPSVSAANVPVGYAAVGGFNANTPMTQGHLFQVSCAALCASFTWLDKTGNLPDIPVDSVIVNPNIPQQVFAGTDFGLYFTNDITAATPQWSRFTNGLPAVMIWDMQVDRGSTTLSLWTRSRGAYVWPLPTNPAVTPTPTASPTNSPTNTPTATPTGTPGVGAISGTVTYGNSIGTPATRFVSSVLISGAGSPNVSGTTNTVGMYNLTGFGSGSYTVTPSKTGAVNGSITSFDAARIAQHSAGISPLTGNQLIVADVSGNGTVSSFDAAEIARYTVSLTGVGATGNWIFLPPGRSYESVTTPIAGQDYSALLMGEVSGNWMDSGSRRGSNGGPARTASVNAIHLVTPANADVIVPVTIQRAADKGIISYEFDLRYDPSVIKPQKDAVELTGTVSSRLSVVFNDKQAGLLRVAVYGPMPISDNGILLNLRFTPVGAPGSVSPLTWERIMFNEGSPLVTAAAGQVELSGGRGF